MRRGAAISPKPLPNASPSPEINIGPNRARATVYASVRVKGGGGYAAAARVKSLRSADPWSNTGADQAKGRFKVSPVGETHEWASKKVGRVIPNAPLQRTPSCQSRRFKDKPPYLKQAFGCPLSGQLAWRSMVSAGIIQSEFTTKDTEHTKGMPIFSFSCAA